MRVLAIDKFGRDNSLDFLMRCQAAGHDVLWWQQPYPNGDQNFAGDGLVPKVKEFSDLQKKWMDWSDLIFMSDNDGYPEFLAPYFEKGYPIFGANQEGAKLENQRDVGQKAFEDAGLDVIPSKLFHDYDQAAAYVEKRGVPCVSKPNWFTSSALTYVAPTAAAMVWMLTECWKKDEKIRKLARKHGFVIQDKVEGCEMAVGGWFGPGGWCQYYSENWEFKKFMDGDRGMGTGEQGTLKRYVKRSKLATKALLPLTATLERIGYVGYLDVNCIIQKDGGVRPLEITARPGWPHFHNHICLLEGDPVKWMKDLMDGFDTLKVRENELSVSVVYTIPDYPIYKFGQDKTCHIPVWGATDREHVHLSEVYLKDDVPCQVGNKVIRMPCLVSGGSYVLVVTGTGSTITAARSSAYAATRKICMPNDPQWRGDIGKGRLVKQLPIIQKLGYATGVEF
jgi:phosphoribosylamine--glycine ligase